MYCTIEYQLSRRNTINVNSPIEPKPSMIAVTVAMALLEPLRDSCWPSSALTAVVIREKGPMMRQPDQTI